MQSVKTAVVVNPASGHGKAGRRWPEIAAAFEREGLPIEFNFTRKAGDATAMTRRFLNAGYELIISVGGDGTAYEVVNGFFEQGRAINKDAAIAFISTGTGSDLIRTLGTPKDYTGAVKHIVNSPVRTIDLGCARYVDNKGIEETSYFINVAGLGLDGETVARVNRTNKAMGGFVSFLWATVVSLLLYRNKKMTITVEDNLIHEGPVTVVVAGNGCYFGGGMKIAPSARMNDGQLDIVILHNMNKGELLINLPRVYKGGHIDNPKVKFIRGRSLKIDSTGRALLNLDGEQPGRAPAEIEIMPLALNLKS